MAFCFPRNILNAVLKWWISLNWMYMLLVVALTLYKFWTTPLYNEKYNTKVWRPSTYNLDSFTNFVVIIFVIPTLFGNNNERISYYSVRFFQSSFFWNKKKKSHAYPTSTNNLPDSLRPDVFVESGVHTDIRGSHHLLRKLTDLFNCTRCPLFESTAKQFKLITCYLVFTIHVVLFLSVSNFNIQFILTFWQR